MCHQTTIKLELITRTYLLGIKLEINNKIIAEKFPNIWKLNNTPQNNPLVKEEITREIKNIYIFVLDNKNNMSKRMHSAEAVFSFNI